MAKIYKIFYWKKGENSFFGTSDSKTEIWTITKDSKSKPWKKGDKILYDTQYAEEYDTNDMPFIELMNVMVKLKVKEINELLNQEPLLSEPFMMFLSNPLNNQEFKEQWKKMLKSIQEAKSSAGDASAMALMSFFK